MKRRLSYVLVALLAIAVPMVVSAAGPDPGKGTTSVYVTNLDSAGSASVTAEYINPSTGAVQYTDSATVPYAGQAEFKGADAGLPAGWSGSMVLSSTREIGSVAMIEWTGGAGGDGKEADTYTGFSAGATKVYAPSLFKRTYQSSRITVQNTDTSTASITVKFYNRGQSTPVHTVTASIPASASKTFDVWDYTQIPQNDPAGGTNNWTGAAVVESAQKVAAVVSTFWQGGTNASSIYSAPATPANTLYVPSLFKKKFANWQIWSGLIILNPNDVTANLTFYFYNRDGTLAIPAATRSIGPFSSDGFNTRYDGDASGEIFYPVSSDWNGLAKIESNVPVVGIVNNIWKIPADQTASYTMLPPAATAGALYYPLVIKNNVGGWQKWAGLIYQNVTNTTANVTTRFYNPNGTEAISAVTASIPAYGGAGWNTRYNTELAGLPASWTGVVVVQSNQPLAGIANLVWTFQAAGYEAVTVP